MVTLKRADRTPVDVTGRDGEGLRVERAHGDRIAMLEVGAVPPEPRPDVVIVDRLEAAEDDVVGDHAANHGGAQGNNVGPTTSCAAPIKAIRKAALVETARVLASSCVMATLLVASLLSSITMP